MVDGVRTFGFTTPADCTAACRIYAQQGIYDQLVEKLGAAVASLKMGAPEDAATELGPLSSLAHLERVSAAVEAAGRCRTLKWSPAAVGLTARAITSSRRCSPAPGRKTLLSSAKCLVR